MATIRDRYPKLAEILDDPKKRRMLLLLLFTVLAFIAIIIYNMSADRKAERATGEVTSGSVIPEIAEGNSKDDLGNTSMMSQRSRNQGRSAADIYENAMPQDDLNLNTDEVKSAERERQDRQALAGTPAQQGMDFFGVKTAEETPSPAPAPEQKTGTGSRTARPSGGSSVPRPQKSADERMADADAYLMSQGIDPKTGLPLPKEDPGEEVKTEEPAEEIPSMPVQVRRTGGISSLDDSFSGPSIDNLDTQSEYITEDSSHPYRVMFIRDQKISDGDRVTVRLLEDLPVGGILIPCNTHLQATVKIGERLNLRVSSFEMNGKLHSLSYSAYDNDGGKGLYCPQTNASKLTKDGARQGGQIASQVLSSGISGIAGRVVQAGTQMAQSSTGKVTVTLVSGYEFFLMWDKD